MELTENPKIDWFYGLKKVYDYEYEEELDKNSKWYAQLRNMDNHTLAFILSKLEKFFIK